MTELVPGDIIHLSAGDMVPADVRLIDTKDLFVSQSALTGESMPVEKHEILKDPDREDSKAPFSRYASPLEMPCFCFMGTSVVSGIATAVTVVTGPQTIFGSLASKVVGHREVTSFDLGVKNVAFLLIKIMLIMAPIVMLITGLIKRDWGEAFLFGLSRCGRADT